MSSQMASRMYTYIETMEGLKKELESHIANLRSATDWADFARLYTALCTIEEIAGVPKTSLEELLGITRAAVPDAFRQEARKISELVLGEQLETEPAAEIEKGS